MKKTLLLILGILFLINLIPATSVGTSDMNKGKVVFTPPTPPFNYSIVNTNSSDFWDNLDDPSDIQMSLLNNDDGFCQYQFTNNNFNGSGNFNTTGKGTFGDLVVDTTTLTVDKINNRVGIGTDSPEAKLHIYTPSGNVAFRVESATDNADFDLKAMNDEFNSFRFLGTGGSLKWGFARLANTLDLRFYSYAGGIGEVIRFVYATGEVLISRGLKVGGDLNVTGIIINDAIYCESSELVDQTFAVAGARYRLNISNVDEGNGITMNTANNGTNITIDTSGVYHMVAQPQVKAGAGSAGDFHMWIEKYSSGSWSDISDSNIELKLENLDEDVIVLATTLKLNQGESLRLVVSVSNNGILLHAQSPAGEPVIPSIIFTMYRMGS